MGDENSSTMRRMPAFPRPPKVYGGLQDHQVGSQPQPQGRRPLGEINTNKPSVQPTNKQSFKNNLSSSHKVFCITSPQFSIYLQLQFGFQTFITYDSQKTQVESEIIFYFEF